MGRPEAFAPEAMGSRGSVRAGTDSTAKDGPGSPAGR